MALDGGHCQNRAGSINENGFVGLEEGVGVFDPLAYRADLLGTQTDHGHGASVPFAGLLALPALLLHVFAGVVGDLLRGGGLFNEIHAELDLNLGWASRWKMRS